MNDQVPWGIVDELAQSSARRFESLKALIEARDGKAAQREALNIHAMVSAVAGLCSIASIPKEPN